MPMLRLPYNFLAVTLTLMVWHAGASTAAADIVWDWSYTTANVSASGTLTTDGTTWEANTTYTVNTITGTYVGPAGTETITGLSSFGGADQLIQWDGTSTSPIFVDGAGLAFSTPLSGDHEITVMTDGPFKPAAIEYNSDGNPTYATITSSSLTPQSVPEPSSLGLCLTAALLLGVALRKGKG